MPRRQGGKPRQSSVLKAIKAAKRPVINPSMLFAQTLNRLEDGSIEFEYHRCEDLRVIPPSSSAAPLQRVATVHTPCFLPLLLEQDLKLVAAAQNRMSDAGAPSEAVQLDLVPPEAPQLDMVISVQQRFQATPPDFYCLLYTSPSPRDS
eukprot:TRINITY_DN55724_c0_g1_i1.p2 TRINITY_DN55724_c0_g1~~TRINITY_DN55724_c0_g1_i1.p2  ORF type:complete len:149 (-),score=26.70 TRINITY_DN55724_c0_g1_i1:34-480(-)